MDCLVPPNETLGLTAYQSLRLRVATLPANGVPDYGTSSTWC